jgi:hypothetical protein
MCGLIINELTLEFIFSIKSFIALPYKLINIITSEFLRFVPKNAIPLFLFLSPPIRPLASIINFFPFKRFPSIS